MNLEQMLFHLEVYFPLYLFGMTALFIFIYQAWGESRIIKNLELEKEGSYYRVTQFFNIDD